VNKHIAVLFASATLASAPLWAETQAADETATLAEVVITSQKRTERLQDVPVSAAVVGTDALANFNASDITDLNRMVPAVQLKGTFNGRVPLAMRGVSTNANEGAIGLTSGVAILLDGVPVPSDSFGANSLDDVAQIEVLKGPQATLGGRTASAGVINIVTGGPADKLEGNVGFTVTGDGEKRVNGRVAGPLMDGLEGSLAGYTTDLRYPVINTRTGRHSDSRNSGGRGKLKLSIGDNFDATAMLRYSTFDSVGENFVPIYMTPGATVFPFIPSAFGPTGPTAFGISQAVAYPGINIRYGNTQYSSPADMYAHWVDTDSSLTLNYRMGDYTLTSITARQKETQNQSQDIFETNVYFFDVLLAGVGASAPHFDNTQHLVATITQTSEELRLVSPASAPVNFIAGLYYSDTNVTDDGLRVWVGNPAAVHNVSGTKTYDLYGRVTAKISDKTSFVGGLRYNKDKLSWDKTQIFNPPAGQFQGCSAANPSPPTCTWSLSDDSSVTVGDLSLQYRPATDVMLYGSYARGYKPRAYNTVHDFISTQAAPNASDLLAAQPVNQEKINHFEVGYKATLLDGRMTLNAALYDTKYDGYQVQIFDTSAVIGVLRLVNGGAETRGAEIDVNFRPAPNTRLSAAASYTDAKITKFPGADCYPTQSAAQGCVAGKQDLSGKPLPDSPKFKLNLDAEQRYPLQSVDLLVDVNSSYRTAAMFQANGNPQTNQPAFALLNASVGLESKSGNLSAALFVNNITDHYYLTNAEDFFSGAMGTAAAPSGAVTPANMVIGQPARDAHRFAGLRFKVKF
jgi:iron complex outermembrane receptor protein